MDALKERAKTFWDARKAGWNRPENKLARKALVFSTLVAMVFWVPLNILMLKPGMPHSTNGTVVTILYIFCTIPIVRGAYRRVSGVNLLSKPLVEYFAIAGFWIAATMVVASPIAMFLYD